MLHTLARSTPCLRIFSHVYVSVCVCVCVCVCVHTRDPIAVGEAVTYCANCQSALHSHLPSSADIHTELVCVCIHPHPHIVLIVLCSSVFFHSVLARCRYLSSLQERLCCVRPRSALRTHTHTLSLIVDHSYVRHADCVMRSLDICEG
jgi:hypothetical protein